MASVTFDQATRRYPGSDRPALDRLDMSVDDGEFVVLVGPSGCGKTTTLRMLAGLEKVDSGRIHIGGRDVTEVDPKDRDVAMVFQNYALYPHMTSMSRVAWIFGGDPWRILGGGTGGFGTGVGVGVAA